MMWHFPMSTSGLDTKEISLWYHIIKREGDTAQTGHGFVQRNIIVHHRLALSYLNIFCLSGLCLWYNTEVADIALLQVSS